MRKQWNKRGTSAGKQADFQSKGKVIKTNSNMRSDKQKQPNQKSVKRNNQTSLAETVNESDVVIEEDRLDFDTFKENYNEFVTIRKLANAIQTKVKFIYYIPLD